MHERPYWNAPSLRLSEGAISNAFAQRNSVLSPRYLWDRNTQVAFKSVDVDVDGKTTPRRGGSRIL